MAGSSMGTPLIMRYGQDADIKEGSNSWRALCCLGNALSRALDRCLLPSIQLPYFVAQKMLDTRSYVGEKKGG
jgi:hypothetical protein